MYVSETYGQTIVDDGNWRDHVKPMAADGVSESGYQARDYAAFPVGSLGASPFPQELMIPRSEWRERIEEKDRKKTWLSDICRQASDVDGIVKWLHQANTNYCWCYAVVAGIMAVRLWHNHPYRRLSPASVAAPIKGYRNQGGWGTQAIKYIIEHGVADEEHWPQNAINRKYFEPSRANAAECKVTEWFDIGDRRFDVKVSACLHNMPVPSGYSWMGHEMCTLRILALDGRDRFGCEDLNSYSSSGKFNPYLLSESKGTADDACCPRVTT